MDKAKVLNIAEGYLAKVRNNNISYSQAWLFGSFAKGNYDENSDIDIALVLDETSVSFETEVKLMTIRIGDETLIEPHAFSKNDFVSQSPIVYQIIHFGEMVIQ